MARLSNAEITEALQKLNGWEQSGDAIEKRYEFPSFAAAMKFVNGVAQVAEQVNHHPDINISYNKVALRLTSHDSGGVTERDLRLAARLSELEDKIAA